MSTGINIAPSSGITVGTTPSTGVDTRVFFQAGGVVQQDANFTFDNTLKRLALKAVGTAGTDIPLSISNSAGTLNLFQVSGNSAYFNGPAATAFTPIFALYRNNLEVFRIDEYKSQFTGNVYMNSIVGPASSGIAFQNQSGSGKLIYMVPTGGTLAIGYGTLTTAAALDVKSQGALSTDIAFRVRDSADTSDLISFRGDGSEWIQSVPFRHAGTLTGGTNTAQSLYLGYNSRGIASSGFRNVIIGTGAGSVISTNDSVCIGHNASAFNTSIAIGSGAIAGANNFCVMGSESYPFSAMSIGTGGTVTSAAAVQNMIFSVGGVAGGYTSNSDLSSKFFRIQSQGGSGTGNSASIQFSVAPSGAAGFSANTFVIPFEVRGDAAGLNHYQLATPRVPSTSITDGYIQYSNDITAGNAAPHFRTEAGNIIKLYQQSSAGITTVGDLVLVLQNLGLLS